MSNKKAIPNRIATESEIRAAIDGYCSLLPTNLDNHFYENFKRGWLNLQHSLEDDSMDARTNFMLNMQSARNQRDELFERCNIQLQNIEQTVEIFISTFETFLPILKRENAKYFIQILNEWKEQKTNHNYSLCVVLTKGAMKYSSHVELSIGEPFKKIGNFILEAISSIEKGIDELGSLYGMYWGIESAMACINKTGQLPKCEGYVTKERGGDDFSLRQHTDKKIINLMNMGHLVDPATKIRFLSLVSNDNHSHQEAYDIIISELKDIGFNPFEFLPHEPKTLAGRARRYRDKQFGELSSLSKN